jgi:exodeoxyribonuclease VII small subunit
MNRERAMSKAETGKKTPDSFEQRIERLERIVEQLEQGEAPLDESLKLFEEGIQLAKACQDQLEEAKERVEVLLEAAEEGKAATEPLEESTGD